MLAYMNCTNSCHSNSADEPFTTPSQRYVRLAAHAQGILLEESPLFKHTMNLLAGSPGMQIVERAVEDAILAEFIAIDRLGGVLAAMEHRYHRSQIQDSAHRYESQIASGERPMIALNRYRDQSGESDAEIAAMPLVRTPPKKRRMQIERLRAFRRKHARHAERALDDLTKCVESGRNTFAELVKTVEHCSLRQITQRLQEIVGRYRPSV
jgi:methylmalonyl-CoA mutase